MVDLEDLNIKKLVEVSEKEQIFLPEFQRPFVWDKNQIKLLVDSLYNDYTISSILLWTGTDELARRRVGGSMRDIIIPEMKDKAINYLLDGQQRTTTLCLVFTNMNIFKKKNKKPERIDLYFDSEYREDNPERRFLFDDEEFTLNGEQVKIGEYSKKELFEKFGTRFVSLKDVYYSDINKVKTDIVDDKLVLDYFMKIQDLKEKILDRRVNVIIQKGELNKVLEIFERINTKNTKLNIFDVMVAKTYQRLENDDFFDLRTFLNIIKSPYGITNDYTYNKEQYGDINYKDQIDDGDLIFLILTMLQDNKTFTQKDILHLTANELITNQKKINKQYIDLIEKLKEFNIEEDSIKKVKPITKFLTAFLSTKKQLSVEDNTFLRSWFWNTLLYNRYPGAQNERVGRDFKLFIDYGYNKALSIMKKDRSRNFQELYFNAYYDEKNQLYSGLEILFFNNYVQDFYNGINQNKTNKGSNSLEMHHIFPLNSSIGKQIKEESKDSEFDNLINNIANLAPLTKSTNSTLIKNKNPSEYIKKFESEYKNLEKYNEFLNIMKSQFITEDMIEMLKGDDFYSFIEKRTQLIKNKIDELCE